MTQNYTKTNEFWKYRHDLYSYVLDFVIITIELFFWTIIPIGTELSTTVKVLAHFTYKYEPNLRPDISFKVSKL